VASRIAFACVISGTLAAPVAAADLGGYPTPRRPAEGVYVPPLHMWAGPYIGLHLGYGWGSSSTYNDPFSGTGMGFDGATNGFDLHPSGWLGGAQAGYNWQWNAFVFGLESDLGYLGAEDGKRTSTAFAKTSYGGYGTLTTRFGYAANRWLFFTKGGLAFASIKNRAGAVVAGANDPTDYTKLNEVHTGWTLGGGAEFAFHRRWSMKLEYLYMDFGTDHSRNLDGDVFDHDNSIHTVKVGVNYRFQWPYELFR
jgi:outer membrane immunogenic protein